MQNNKKILTLILFSLISTSCFKTKVIGVGSTVITSSSSAVSGFASFTSQLINGVPGVSSATGMDTTTMVAANANGDVCVVGYTNGSLGSANAGGADGFVARYNSSGSLIWLKQMGTGVNEYLNGVALDTAGNCYFTGVTGGALYGASGGGGDVIVGKYSPTGTLVWGVQFGTGYPGVANPAGNDYGVSIAVDSTGANIYIAGYTDGALNNANGGSNDIFAAKLNSTGAITWLSHLGTGFTGVNTPTSDDRAYSVAIDSSGNVYVAAHTFSNLAPGITNCGAQDMVLIKFSSAGAITWMSQLGTGFAGIGSCGTGDIPYAVVVDSSDTPYISGVTASTLGGANGGALDVVLAKFNPATGAIGWITQLGSAYSGINSAAGTESVSGMAIDSAGNLYVSGHTNGSLGATNGGGQDVFILKASSTNGSKIWLTQLGSGASGVQDTSGNDYSAGVAVTPNGLNVYSAGYTFGNLVGANSGNSDVFLLNFNSSGSL